ncbi:MAG: hypothetical protein ABR526_12770 [Chthoniobacterales bacterium]
MVLICLLSAALAGVWVMKSQGGAAKPVPEPKQQTSEHNWAKHSLDRTAELKQQIAQQQKEDAAR